MRKGVTLIEVVIAIVIVAILSAIFIPTLGQHRDQVGQSSLANYQRIGQAMIAYSQAFDDRLPFAMIKRPDGAQTWGTATYFASPSNVGGVTPARAIAARYAWHNSIQPYLRSYVMGKIPGAPSNNLSPTLFVTAPPSIGMLMNGLLHNFRTTSVNSPNIVPLLWSGQGFRNLKGRACANPTLECGASLQCEFNPTGLPSQLSAIEAVFFRLDAETSYWIENRTFPLVRLDTSVSMEPIGTQIEPNTTVWPNINIDPLSSVTATGVPAGFWNCGPGHTVATPSPAQPGQGAYPCYFRPDRTE